MKVRSVTSLRQFDALAPAWQDLLDQTGQHSPLLSHDWFASSWRTAGPERRRELLVVEDAAGPVAFVPLVHARTKIHGLPIRRVSVLSPADAPFVEFPIAASADQILAIVVEFLRARRDWDMLSLTRLPAHSPIYKALGGALAGRLSCNESGRSETSCLTIAGTWAGFLNRLSGGTGATCRSIEEELRECGEVSLEEHRQCAPDDHTFLDLVELSRSAWHGASGEAETNIQGLSRFYRELTQRASQNGWLRLWILRVAGRPVAAEYQIGANGSLYVLRRDQDPSVRELAPLRGLGLLVVQALFEQGNVVDYHLGRGSAIPGLDWPATRQENVDVDVYGPTTMGAVLRGIQTRLVPAARRWRRQEAEPCG